MTACAHVVAECVSLGEREDVVAVEWLPADAGAEWQGPIPRGVLFVDRLHPDKHQQMWHGPDAPDCVVDEAVEIAARARARWVANRPPAVGAAWLSAWLRDRYVVALSFRTLAALPALSEIEAQRIRDAARALPDIARNITNALRVGAVGGTTMAEANQTIVIQWTEARAAKWFRMVVKPDRPTPCGIEVRQADNLGAVNWLPANGWSVEKIYTLALRRIARAFQRATAGVDRPVDVYQSGADARGPSVLIVELGPVTGEDGGAR